MTQKEAQNVLDELNNVHPEMLNENAKRLFEAIMKIADERDELQARNKELEKENENFADTLYHKQIMIDELTKKVEKWKIKLGKEKILNDGIYPIGAIYFSYSGENPNEILGGYWELMEGSKDYYIRRK